MIINYQDLLDECMLEVVRKVLAKIQIEGLGENHHFYISFYTTHSSVLLSHRMKQKYPEEITIVLQYQYEDLVVSAEGFGVKISFGGAKENIFVPFKALTSFVDPAAKFSLQFKQLTNENNSISDLKLSEKKQKKISKVNKEEDTNRPNNVIDLSKFRKKNNK